MAVSIDCNVSMSIVFEVNSALTTVVDSASEVAVILAVKDSPATVVLFGAEDSSPVVVVFKMTTEVDCAAGTSLAGGGTLAASDSLKCTWQYL